MPNRSAREEAKRWPLLVLGGGVPVGEREAVVEVPVVAVVLRVVVTEPVPVVDWVPVVVVPVAVLVVVSVSVSVAVLDAAVEVRLTEPVVEALALVLEETVPVPV